MTCRGCGPSPDPEQDREHNDWCPDNPRRDLATTEQVVRDLIEALESALGCLVFFGTDQLEPFRAQCRAAIAKARGQSTSTDNAMTAAERSMFSMEAERDAARKERDAAQQIVAELRAVLTAGRDIVIETSRRHTRWVEGAYDTLEASAPIANRWCLASERDEALRLLATLAIERERAALLSDGGEP